MDISSHAGGELEMTLQPMRSFWGVYPLISTYAYIHLLQTQIFWKTHFFGVSSVSTRFTIQVPRHAMPAQYHGPGTAATAVRGAAESPRLVPDTSNTRPSDGVKVRSWGAHATDCYCIQ